MKKKDTTTKYIISMVFRRANWAMLLLILMLTACTEDINLSVVGGEKQVVIEGRIENGKPAEVIVTRNSPVSQAIDINTILVTDAKVYVSDGTITDTLILTVDSFASFPLLYRGSAIIGEANKTYNLTVTADGGTYTANTTIPTPVALDSVWWKAQPPEDTLGFAWAHISEPAGLGNGYRWYAKRPSDRRYIAPNGATFDDKFIDGKSFDFAYNRGIDATDPNVEDPKNADYGYYKKTDYIYIKFCAIDYATEKFYSTYETAQATNGNPFASPVTIISNINGGALGVWGGFGCTYDTIRPQ